MSQRIPILINVNKDKEIKIDDSIYQPILFYRNEITAFWTSEIIGYKSSHLEINILNLGKMWAIDSVFQNIIANGNNFVINNIAKCLVLGLLIPSDKLALIDASTKSIITVQLEEYIDKTINMINYQGKMNKDEDSLRITDLFKSRLDSINIPPSFHMRRVYLKHSQTNLYLSTKNIKSEDSIVLSAKKTIFLVTASSLSKISLYFSIPGLNENIKRDGKGWFLGNKSNKLVGCQSNTDNSAFWLSMVGRRMKIYSMQNNYGLKREKDSNKCIFDSGDSDMWELENG
jgi:hypothetical protein